MKEQISNFLNKWSKITNVDLSNKDSDTYLIDLGIDSIKLIEMASELEQIYNVVIKKQDLLSLKIKHLYDLKKYLSKINEDEFKILY